MNARERVLTSLKHQVPDRCPINFRATDKIIDAMCKHYNRNYLALLDYLNVDFREVTPGYVGPAIKKMKDNVYYDIWGVGRKEVVRQNSRDVFVSHSPLSEVKTVNDVKKHNWPSIDYFYFGKIEKKCDLYDGYAISTPGIHAEGYHGVFHMLTYLFGMEKAMMQMISDENIMQEAIKQVMFYLTAYYEELLKSANGKIDFLFYKDDFGAQNNLMISRDMFCKYFAPGIKELVELADAYDATLMLHSCGSIFKLIPDFIDLGVKVLDPIQTSAKDMDIKVLKDQFGQSLTFHGGIDTQVELPNCSPDEIKELVCHTIDILGKGGGYFFSPSHRIQQDTPLANVIAMYEAANDYSLTSKRD